MLLPVIIIIDIIQYIHRPIAIPLSPSEKFKALYKKKMQKTEKNRDAWFKTIMYSMSWKTSALIVKLLSNGRTIRRHDNKKKVLIFALKWCLSSTNPIIKKNISKKSQSINCFSEIDAE